MHDLQNTNNQRKHKIQVSRLAIAGQAQESRSLSKKKKAFERMSWKPSLFEVYMIYFESSQMRNMDSKFATRLSN